MVAMVPMTLRGEEKGGDRGNQVGFTLMPVHSDIADPLERLHAINQSAQTSKRVTDAVGKELARDLLEYLPTPISRTLLRNVKLPGIGLIVSNVRGPDAPLYMAGAQLVNYSPSAFPSTGLGLNVTGFSCAGTMWICAVSCREMMPDPAFFAECLRGSFEDLKQAAAGHADAVERRRGCSRHGGEGAPRGRQASGQARGGQDAGPGAQACRQAAAQGGRRKAGLTLAHRRRHAGATPLGAGAAARRRDRRRRSRGALVVRDACIAERAPPRAATASCSRARPRSSSPIRRWCCTSTSTCCGSGTPAG